MRLFNYCCPPPKNDDLTRPINREPQGTAPPAANSQASHASPAGAALTTPPRQPATGLRQYDATPGSTSGSTQSSPALSQTSRSPADPLVKLDDLLGTATSESDEGKSDASDQTP